MSTTGITYYKLEDHYPGDITKGCGLTGSEIDNNFHFLRGFDIKSAIINEEKGTIELERLNCEKIVILGVKDYIKKITQIESFNLEGTTYDNKEGVLHICINQEEAIAVSGFYTKVIGGDGIKGDGTYSDPLKVDGLLLTGFFAPVKTFVDYEKGESLPEKGEKGDRYLTREYNSPYGFIYTYAGVKRIEELLKDNSNGWRIPTIEDWDEMLNYLECPEYRNHNNHIENSENGKLAGYLLKDNIWDEEIIGDKGFKVLPTFYDRNNKKYTIFWSSSDNGLGGIHSKSLHEGRGTVQHRVENTDSNNLYSIRLVRDINTPFIPVEVINGVTYDCVEMKSLKNDVITTKSWTVQNITVNGLEDDSDKPEIYDEGTFKYYLNEWNSITEQWDKREFIDSSIVTIKSYKDFTNEPFILKDGELEPYFMSISEDILDTVRKWIIEEAELRMEADTELDEKIDAEIRQRTAEVKDLSERIMAETSERKAEDDSLSQRISKESAERKTEDASLSERIVDEAKERANQDDKLSQRIIDETIERGEQDDKLSQRIIDEANERIKHDIQVKEYNATTKGVSLNTNGGDSININFDGSFGTVDFYNE